MKKETILSLKTMTKKSQLNDKAIMIYHAG